jgi:hypothetical protein
MTNHWERCLASANVHRVHWPRGHRASLSSSSAYYSLLLDIGFSNLSASSSIIGYSHPAPASRPAQIVTPPGLRASYTTFTWTRSPVQNSFTPAVIGSTADMAIQLPLQHAYTVCYVGDFRSLPDHRFRIRSRRETPSIALSTARWATLNLWTSRAVSVHFSAPVMTGRTHWLKTFVFRLCGIFFFSVQTSSARK